MSSTASANKARDTSKKKKADADPVNNPVFDGGATNASLSTATGNAVRPKRRSDIQGAAEFNEKSTGGKIKNDLAMGVGAKPKDDSYDFRTQVTKSRNSEAAASAAAARSSAREGDERDASGKRIRDLDYVAPIAAPTVAADTADTAAAAGSSLKVTPPDPDVLALAANAGNAGAAETAVMEGISAADATATLPEAKPITKLGRKSTIATSNQGISDEPEPEPEPAATARKIRKADRNTTIATSNQGISDEPEPAATARKTRKVDRAATVATSSQGLLSQTQPSLRRRRSLMGMIK